MCRSKNVCSELGVEIEKWNTNCPLPTPRWMNDQINIFLDAVDGFISGNKDACFFILKQIQNEQITLWYIEHGQMSGRHRNIQLKKLSPPPIEKKLLGNNYKKRLLLRFLFVFGNYFI